MSSELTPLALYVHVPFCKAKCTYCDFYSLAGGESSIPRYLDALITEIKSAADQHDLKDYEIDTIFFGGGTPNVLTPSQLKQILTALNGLAPMGEKAEIGLEVNPGEASLDALRAYRKLGFNRVSIGMQSFHQKLLTFMSRIHDPEQSFETFRHTRDAGFTNISGDLIFAVPGQTREMWLQDLQKLIDLGPEHISTYSLTVEEGTALKRWVDAGHVHMLEETIDTGMYAAGRELLERAGYTNYEVSNFARPGFECRHNLNYWTGVEYIGFGPSAHSYFANKRWWNPRDLHAYMSDLEASGTCKPEIEAIDSSTAANEMIMTRLRLSAGLDLVSFRNQFNVDLVSERQEILIKWKDALFIQDNHLMIGPEGWALIDEISSDLMLSP